MAIKALTNEQQLLINVSEGDERAFKKLFEGYCDVLGEFVFKLTKSIEIAEEIVQDIFLKIWLKRDSLAEIQNFNNYIFILCRNLALDHLRDQAKEKIMIRHMGVQLQENLTIEQLHNTSDKYHILIDEAVKKLPAQSQKVYLLSRHERLKYEEIGKMLGISRETVKKHIQYATAFIKKELTKHSDISPTIIMTVMLTQLIIK